jgi:hypothetical protein
MLSNYFRHALDSFKCLHVLIWKTIKSDHCDKVIFKHLSFGYYELYIICKLLSICKDLFHNLPKVHVEI